MDVITYEWVRLVLLDYIEVLTTGEVSDNQTLRNSAITDARLLLNRVENKLDVMTEMEISKDE